MALSSQDMIWLSKEDNEDKPKGFEKFFKKKDDKKEPSKESKQDPKSEHEEKNELSDEEDSTHDKKDKKSKDDSDDTQNFFHKLFFDPDNNPKPEGFLSILAALSAAYYLSTYQKPQKEVVYMQFLNDYLLKNLIPEIIITKDKRSEVFNFRASFKTTSGEHCYLTLSSYESFLAKLDLIQREMGK